MFIKLSGIPEGQYIDTRQNNGGPFCNPPNQIIHNNPSTHVSTQSPAVSTQQPTPHTTTTQTIVVGKNIINYKKVHAVPRNA